MATSIRWKIDDNVCKELHKTVVYRFTVGYDLEEDAVSNVLSAWWQSDAGKFIATHSVIKPILIKNDNISLFQPEYAIVAELETKKLSEFYMKWK